jgi:CBS domain-containing protein
MGLVARDVMERHVISLSPDDPLGNVQRLFSEEAIHGAPVVDETGRVLGVVSSIDLLRAAVDARETADAADSRYLSELIEYSPSAWRLDEEAVSGDLRVSDVMSEGAVCVGADDPIAVVARTLREQRVHRVLVVEDDRLCGIISSFDLVALLEGERS